MSVPAEPAPAAAADKLVPLLKDPGAIAVVLSAQATDVGVNKATRRLFAAAPTPQAMLDLGDEAHQRVLLGHVDVVGLLDERDDLDRRERRLPAALVVERADPHQPVGAGLDAERAGDAVGVDHP